MGAALFFAALFSATGCETVSVRDSRGAADDPAASGPEDGSVSSEKRAYYMLHNDDISGPGWEARLAGYEVFVCDPSFDNRKLQRIRTAIPKARLLAATSAQDALIDRFQENAYFRALAVRFDSTLCIRDLVTGNVVRIYQREQSTAAVPAFVMRRESADALVAFHRDITMEVGWDGLYVDMLTNEWSVSRKRRLEEITTTYDIDNDGVADTLYDLDRTYETWRPYFTQQLRDALGATTILIGNAGGRLADPALNGITLEKVGERFSLHQARWYFMIQKLYSDYPPLSIGWVFDAPHEGATLQLARELDWVHFGQIDE
jgi:hypothetical protein